ncbi:hypothetical protein [Bradyrhizobium sp. USDA 4452]
MGTMAEPDPIPSPAEEVERKVDAIIRELDEFCAMANNPETADLVEGQKIAFGQMMVRIQLIMGFLLAGKQPAFRIVR